MQYPGLIGASTNFTRDYIDSIVSVFIEMPRKSLPLYFFFSVLLYKPYETSCLARVLHLLVQSRYREAGAQVSRLSVIKIVGTFTHATIHTKRSLLIHQWDEASTFSLIAWNQRVTLDELIRSFDWTRGNNNSAVLTSIYAFPCLDAYTQKSLCTVTYARTHAGLQAAKHMHTNLTAWSSTCIRLYIYIYIYIFRGQWRPTSL